jgi:hypothetical protein
MKKTFFLFAILTAVAFHAFGQTVPGAHLYLLGNDDAGAFYLKDGVRFALPGTEAYSGDMVVDGGHVYVAGHYKNNGVYRACYWRDGVMQQAIDGTFAHGIAVSAVKYM